MSNQLSEEQLSKLKETIRKRIREFTGTANVAGYDTPHAFGKNTKGDKELKNQLAEIEKFVGWYNRLRSENNLGKHDFFKRTNTNIYRIKERIIKIASSIQEIDKSENEESIEEIDSKKAGALEKYAVTATPKGSNPNAKRVTLTKPAPKATAQTQAASFRKMDKYQTIRLKKA